jgi:hypothetical protein
MKQGKSGDNKNDWIGIYYEDHLPAADWQDRIDITEADLLFSSDDSLLDKSAGFLSLKLLNIRRPIHFKYVRPLPSGEDVVLAKSKSITFVDIDSVPLQVHLALTEHSDSLSVTFVTNLEGGTPVVRLLDNSGNLRYAYGEGTHTVTYSAEDMCESRATEVYHGSFAPVGVSDYALGDMFINAEFLC